MTGKDQFVFTFHGIRQQTISDDWTGSRGVYALLLLLLLLLLLMTFIGRKLRHARHAANAPRSSREYIGDAAYIFSGSSKHCNKQAHG